MKVIVKHDKCSLGGMVEEKGRLEWFYDKLRELVTKEILLQKGQKKWHGSYQGSLGRRKIFGGRNNNGMLVILMGVISRELKMDEVGKRTQIAGVIPLSGQDEGIIFR